MLRTGARPCARTGAMQTATYLHPDLLRRFPKISIITPSFNQAPFLEETICSVLNQRYPHLEYIIIDGGSTDGSVEIIKRYESHLAYWVSEPDRGQAHALNKGLRQVTGEIVAFLNSDDLYLPGALMAVAEYFCEHADCKWLCGDTLFFGNEGCRTELIQARVPQSVAHCLMCAYNAPQPGMFWRRELLNAGFQERLRYSFDHELYVRLLLAGYRCEHLTIPVAAYRYHVGSKSVAEGHRFGNEFDEIAERYENQLTGTGRRWCRSVRFLKQAYQAGQVGKTREAMKYLFLAFLIHPEGTPRRRLFWKCLHQLLRSSFL
ncbi:MAG TPA: glycosyltransferase family 2 protein [Candidatus Limnocylindrales bacterium]|nr:glycosyltransferase family 2 protein [Candidatus Limnocylindrales bacterium]